MSEIKQTRNVLMEKLIEEGYFGYKGFIQNEVNLTPLVTFKMFARYYELPPNQANLITTSDEGKEFLKYDKKKKWYEHDTDWLEELVLRNGLQWDGEWDIMKPILKYCYKWNKTPYNSSIAASGVIMTSYQPDLPARNGVIALNGHDLEDNGYIKYDLLSIDTLNQIKPFYGMNPDWTDTSDKNVWNTVYNGKTDFVFQFGSSGMKKILTEAHVDTIDKMAETTGIFRPGPLELGMMNDYIEASKGELHQEDVLTALGLIMKRIYGPKHSGLIIFQEEVMSLCQVASGFSLREADQIRKSLGKKIKSLLDSYETQFIDNFKFKNYYEIEDLGKFLDDEILIIKNDDGTTSEATAEEIYHRVEAGEILDVETKELVTK